MKLVQLNMWSGRLERQVANFFKEQQPDIACLQETISIKGNGAIFIGFEDLQKCWQKPTYGFHAPMFSFKFMNRTARFGNGIISTMPFAGQDSIYVNLEHVEDFDFEEHDYNVRNFQHVSISLESKILHVLNHHGFHIPEHKNGDRETLRQMQELADYIDGLNGPVILAGDFNLAPHSQSLEQINARLINLSVKHKLETTRNQLTYKKEVCDYIFINPEIKVNDFTASDVLLSDHRALILDFDI